MSDNMLKKEFRSRDVQRMRNIITKKHGDKTGVQVGYTPEYTERKEGDVWEVDGKQWTIKNGIKQTTTKLDSIRKRITMPLTCPKCRQAMKNRLDKIMYPIHSICFDCVVKHETNLKRLGKYEEYQLNINKQGLAYHLKEMEAVLFELLLGATEESFVTEAGDIETWKNNDSFRQQAITEVQDYIQKIKDVLNS
jgi:bacterioferritin-associated ferredoxin